MMRVTLVEFTGKGSKHENTRAADVMIWTKHTRIEMGPGSLEEIQNWPYEKKLEELRYMANTIPSSWEFLDYTFMIQGVTRALTHQLVRARTMSFAQQTMQVLDMSQGSGWTYETGPTIDDTSMKFPLLSEEAISETESPTRSNVYETAMHIVAESYKALVASGAKIEDARNLLPTGIHTNIVMKCNMRSLVQLIHARESPRNLGEISNLMILLKKEVLQVHPWMTIFFERTADQACRDLDEEIKRLPDGALSLPGQRMHLHKLVDQLRQKS